MQSFQPPERTLMGPGPSDVHPRVLAAMARPTIGHLDPAFQTFMEELKAGLRAAFKTENALTIPVSAPGSAGMETCFANLVEPGDTVVICQNGVFGGRMRENVTRAGGNAVMVEAEWGRSIDLDATEAALKDHPEAKILAFVHAETSTGVRADAAALCALARQHDCLSIMDTVTGLGGIPVDVDGWGADAVYSGTQKCLSAPPGLSPVTFSDRAVAVIKARAHPVQSWFLDLTLVMDYWDGAGGRSYHHTAPVNALYGLHEALLMLHEEGLDAAWARHAHMHTALKAGLEAMGLSLLVDAAHRLPQLNAVSVPDSVDEAAIRKFVLERYDLEIGAGLGTLAGKVWRLGLMGQSARPDRVIKCLAALEDALAHQQAPISRGKAIPAAQAALPDDS
ncbi:MAG: alanine--glyoxylate aminotransferase family protein [Sphingomonadales bacterium]|nr:alanine--glyoxylate aminotransferase family protein [Sphingomonadales bacterium]